MPPSTKSGAISLYGETPEEQEGIQRVKQTQRELREALESRQNQLFDPVMLALAQGFLSPTKAGGFGESIANAAALVGPAQEREQKRQIEMAQIRAELAAQELGQMQATRGEREYQRLMRGMAGDGAPVGAAGAPGVPAGAEGAASGAEAGAGPMGAPPAGASGQQFRPINEFDIAALAGMPGQEGKAKALMDALKTQRDRFMISQNGIVFDRAAGRYLDLEIPGQKQEEFETPYGKFLMTPNEYAQFSRANRQGKGREWIDEFRRPGAAPGAAKPAAEGEPGGRRTVGQAAAESAQQKSYAEATGTEMAKATREKIALGDDALSRRQTAESIQALASKEGMNQVVGIFEKPGIPAAIFKTIEEGISLGRGYGISAPQIREILSANKIQLQRNPGETKDQYDARVMDVISNLQQMSSLFAQSIFGLRSLAKGQGAISNLENRIFESMAPTVRDTLQTIMAKTSHAKARADFDQKVADMLLSENMSWDQLRKDTRYREMVRDYDKQLLSIYSGTSAGRAAGAARPSGSRPSGGSAESAAVLRQELDL